MANLAKSRFLAWDLTDEEKLAGHTLSDLNIKMIQNEVSKYANTFISQKYTDEAPTKQALEQAWLLGAIEALEYLIAAHEAVQQATAEGGMEEY